MKRCALHALLLFWTSLLLAKDSWVVFYGEKAPFAQLRTYSLLVFDADHHPSVEIFEDKKALVLGYLSMGEVEEMRSHFSSVRSEGLLLDANPNWKESYFVDVRDPRFAQRVIEELIPQVLFQRFDGIFIDTLDNAEYLEDLDPVKYQGMRLAAIRLVQAIRLNYPQIKIMLNRGFALLPELANYVDMLLGESIYTTYDFEKKKYVRAPQAEYEMSVKIMHEAKVRNPKLKLYSLDYWDPEDVKTIREIYRVQRAQGLNPYVATIGLDKIIPEPKE